MFDYSGKTVFVSGGTSGINRGIAEGFARAGARLFVISRKQDKVDDTVAALMELGAEADGASADVREIALVKEAFSKCAERFGDIDVLVSGAAGNFPSTANNLSSNGFRAVMEIDVLGTHHVMISAYPHLRKPGAAVINISAPQAYLAMTWQIHVCAAKAGVDMITRTLALEWGADGIRVNSVVPGPIKDTEGMARLAPIKNADEIVANEVPMRRMGTKDDIANMCMFLGSEAATYVSGTVIAVDGGWSLNMKGTMFDDMMKAFANQSKADAS